MAEVEQGPETPSEGTPADLGIFPETGPTGDISEPASEPSSDEPVGTEGETPSPQAWFEYGDRTFGQPEELKQYISSMEGRLRAEAQKAKLAAEANTEWDQWYQQYRGQIEPSLKEEKASHDKPEDKGLLGATDWAHVKDLIERGDGEKALQFLQYSTDNYLKNQFKSVEERILSEIKPIKAEREQQTFARELMLAAHDAVHPETGDYLYPEFNENSGSYDSDFVKAFAQQWRSLPGQIANDPEGYGVDLAYHRTRAIWNGRAARQTQASEAGKQAGSQARELVRDASGRFVKQTEAQANAVGSSSTPPPEGSPEADNSDKAWKKRIRESVKVNSFLGISE